MNIGFKVFVTLFSNNVTCKEGFLPGFADWSSQLWFEKFLEIWEYSLRRVRFGQRRDPSGV